jgi:8-oxo-dGTP pyrophosphatase MutT (NUDIX family)
VNAQSARSVRRTVALLIARFDGTIIVGTDNRPPTADAEHDSVTATARLLEHRCGLTPATLHEAVIDSAEEDDGTLVRHHVLFRGITPEPAPTAGPYRAVPFGHLLSGLPRPLAARLRTASRAGLLRHTAHLANGSLPGSHPTRAERTRACFAWFPYAESPSALEIRQVWGWLTDPTGRVLVLLDSHGTPSLPGGRPEPDESPTRTLIREAAEEAAARIGSPAGLGYQQVIASGQPPYAQLRMAAPLRGLGPAAPDPDTGQTYRRVLLPARYANLLLGWGPEGDTQAAAVANACRAAPPTTLAFDHVPARGWSPPEEKPD